MGVDVKKMAEALKMGATMLDEACPQCNSPLFKMPSGEVYCINCNQKIVLVKTEEEALKVSLPTTLGLLEETILKKIQQLEQKIRTEDKPENLQVFINLIISYLETLEKIRKVRKTK
ncbi:hypothetical protein DRO26_03930 [Candidatus Bathyarchaeota archaeon]|nr:MAG: hypothetical protein DRO26_03930 [Candidatus Bathyarchaeota archaeon]